MAAPEPPGPTSLPERLHVILVEPQFPGNVGSVARALANFGVGSLHLVRPCPITDEARDRAVHAQGILDRARIWESWQECFEGFDHLVAFTARVSESDRSHRRNYFTLAEFAAAAGDLEGRVALVFGREDDGLRNEEVEPCDVVVTIPTSPAYPSMNLSHAVSVALYAVAAQAAPRRPRRHVPASHAEKELLFRYYAALLRELRLPEHRQVLTLQMYRRILGRAGLSRWEYHRLMGVTSESLKSLGAWPPKDLPPLPPMDEGAGEE